MNDPTHVRLCSGPPWHLEVQLERVGGDLLCRIHGGDHHIGAVAMSQWDSGQARTERLTAEGHKEGELAAHAAHRLCKASRRRVTCIAGIHFDSLSRPQIDEIVEAVHILTRRAARSLAQRRRLEALEAPGCLLHRIAPAKERLSAELTEYLALPLDEAVSLARSDASAAVTDHFDNRVAVFAPLYLSNACANDCRYCGFRASATIDRARLSVDGAVSEARHLVSAGHRMIDLVTGEIATDAFVDYVCEATRAILAQTDIRRVNLNLGALSTEQYRRLREAGATGYNLYQETYAPRTYFEVHGLGLKRDMAHRLDGPHRVAAAGFEAIGLGVLLGLHDLADDLAALAAHAELLLEDFPDLGLGFSLPRLQRVDPDCDFQARTLVPDAAFIRAMLWLRLRFPRAHLTLTTRESPELRDRLLPLGVTKLSAGVSTAPGGYSLDPSAAVQFDIADLRGLPEIIEVVQRSGRTPWRG
ncbi:MAG TPA: radical SAM protein [Myxococcota bacterium]|nr:radical SAM protein [Myxococcota bacterium]